MKYIASLLFASALLSSCVEPAPVYVISPLPEAKKTSTYCPPTRKTTPKTTPTASTNTESGRNVDGRFIRDTPPDELEPAKTIRVEKDN